MLNLRKGSGKCFESSCNDLWPHSAAPGLKITSAESLSAFPPKRVHEESTVQVLEGGIDIGIVLKRLSSRWLVGLGHVSHGTAHFQRTARFPRAA
jgi:hypothetical protein